MEYYSERLEYSIVRFIRLVEMFDYKKKITSDPKNIYIAKVFSSISELHSWHIFIAIFAIPPLASGLAMVSLPESPKFLMSRGRNDEALEVFKKIYSMNTGKSPDTYPVIWLFDTISTFR